MKSAGFKLNTSNQGKYKEFRRLFDQYGMGLEATHIDLKEIDATPLEVVAHKASQLEEGILVEDTSLDIESAHVGIHIRYLLDHLPEYVGRKAVWTVLLGHRKGDEVVIYRGEVLGEIVEPRGLEGFGFDPVFLPEGATQTLSESKPDLYNARAKAVEALFRGEVWKRHPIITDWKGSWQ